MIPPLGGSPAFRHTAKHGKDAAGLSGCDWEAERPGRINIMRPLLNDYALAPPPPSRLTRESHCGGPYVVRNPPPHRGQDPGG